MVCRASMDIGDDQGNDRWCSALTRGGKHSRKQPISEAQLISGTHGRRRYRKKTA